MKKTKEIGAVGTIVLFAAVLLVATLFGACNRNQKEQVIQTRSNQSTDTTIVVEIDGIKFESSLETMPNGVVYGVIVGTKINTGESQTWSYPLGGFNFPDMPIDTTLDVPTTNHGSFSTSHDSTSFDDMEIYHITKHTISGVDQYNTATYELNPLLEWNNGSVDCWGYNIEFPRRYPTLAWASVTPSEIGGDGTWDYTKLTTAYKISCFGMEMLKYGYHITKREAGSHDFIRKELQSAVWTPIEYNNGFVTRARVDVKIASFYEGLDPQIDEEQIEVDCPVHIAGDSSMYANNFDFSHSTPVTGTYSTTGTYTEGHFQVTKKSITYSVGTSIFTRVSSFGCFDLVWSDGTYTFPIQTPDYGSFNEVSYTVDDLSAQNGYDRKRVTNTISASINGISASAPIRTTVLVESQTPPPPQEGETVLLDSALIYVNETTSISRLTFQVQYPDGTADAPYNVDCTIHNDVSSPAEGPFYTNDFNNVGVVGQITLEPIVYDGYYYDGDFLKKQYHRNAKVDCGVFELPWVLSWEDPYYVPMGNKKMPSAQYSAFVSSGNYTDDLGEITSQNETWLRKIWTQWITTEFNNHNHQYSGTAEVRAPNTIPKITPDWFGNPMEAHYTLVQPYVGAQFQDMIVFRFEHGIIMAPNGIPDTNLIYAFTAADAAAHGVDQVYTPQAWWSGVFLNGKWWPAYITITSSEWTYSYDGTPIHSHTVQKANAFILNIGYECNPDPQHQYYTISNNGVITICYNAHNQGETVTAQCQIR